MNRTDRQISQPAIKDSIRRVLGFKALRALRGMVDEIEREEAADRKLKRVLLVVLPAALILVIALFIWFRYTVSVQTF